MAVVALTRGKKEVGVPTKEARTIASIIKKGVALVTRIEVTNEAIKNNNARLLPLAEQLAESTGLASAVYKSEDGMATVRFGESICYDAKDMEKIKTVLGPLFPQMFHEIPSFAVATEDIPEIKKKLGKDFDRLVQAQSKFKHTAELKKLLVDGDSAVSKKLRKLISIEPNKPSFKFDKTPDRG